MRPNVNAPNDAVSAAGADLRRATLRLWLSAGTVLCLLVPVEAWYHPVVGWLPYWWVVTPAIGLALLRRGSWLRHLRAWCARASLRRPTPVRRRARRVAAHRTRPRAAPSPVPARLIRG
jgi:hypothetical protein